MIDYTNSAALIRVLPGDSPRCASTASTALDTRPLRLRFKMMFSGTRQRQLGLRSALSRPKSTDLQRDCGMLNKIDVAKLNWLARSNKPVEPTPKDGAAHRPG